MDPPEPDEELVRRFLLGETDAFERLVERHRQRVYNLCLRVLGDPEDAADAVQDTFLSVLTKLRQFRGDAAFTTWMHRVAVNACYDLTRKRRRQPLTIRNRLRKRMTIGTTHIRCCLLPRRATLTRSSICQERWSVVMKTIGFIFNTGDKE